MTTAVVMAAGEGRRLRPLTEEYAKPVLPIDGQPVISTLVRELAGGGATRVWVVVGYRGDQIRRLLGDGRGFAVEVRYAEQREPDGSAGAVRAALAEGAELPFVVAGADTLFARGDVAGFVRGAADAAIAYRRDPPPEPPRRWATAVRDGRVVRVLDDDPANPFAGAPLWHLTPELTPHFEGLGGPPYELAELMQRAIDAGVAVRGVEVGPTRDLTYPLDLVRENFTYLGSL